MRPLVCVKIEGLVFLLFSAEHVMTRNVKIEGGILQNIYAGSGFWKRGGGQRKLPDLNYTTQHFLIKSHYLYS